MNEFIIGCIPNSSDFRHPQDRRRYLPYFKENGIVYERAKFNKFYNVLYVSLSADLNKWYEYKNSQARKGNSCRVVFDLSDFYLASGVVSNILRSLFHFVTRRTSVLSYSYTKTLKRMIDNSDVVICGSEEQKKLLDELHNNVKIVRDYFYDDINIVKSRYELNKPGELNVLWEGLSHGGKEIFKLLKEILNSVDSLKINVHIVCDSEYCQLGSSYFCRSTYKVLKHIFKNSSVSFHHYDWCSSTFSSIATACDIAVIPIPDNEFMKKKPENKLIFLWLMGIPVISSDIDSYKRVMSEASLDYYCSDLSDWKNKLESLASSRSERLKYMNNVNTYLKANYSKESIFQMNEAIFFSNL